MCNMRAFGTEGAPAVVEAPLHIVLDIVHGSRSARTLIKPLLEASIGAYHAAMARKPASEWIVNMSAPQDLPSAREGVAAEAASEAPAPSASETVGQEGQRRDCGADWSDRQLLGRHNHSSMAAQHNQPRGAVQGCGWQAYRDCAARSGLGRIVQRDGSAAREHEHSRVAVVPR